MLTQQEWRLAESLIGAINMLSERLPDLTKAIENSAPTSNHQRQVAALRRQSEAVEMIDRIIVQLHDYKTYETEPASYKVKGQGGIEFEETIHMSIKRRLKELRQLLTG
jgi:hypothetical protein